MTIKKPTMLKVPPWVFIVIGFVALVVLWSRYPQPAAELRESHSRVENVPIEMVRRKIDGVRVPKGTIEVPPLAVVIDNFFEARPPAGLSKADLVWEAPAEANITRLVAIYGDGGHAPKVGPVRSLRPYFLDFALEVGAPIAHVGGSPEALELARLRRATHLDEFGSGQFFWRDTSRPRPHNVYTSTDLLRQAFDIFSPLDKGEGEGADIPLKPTPPLKVRGGGRGYDEGVIHPTYVSWPYKDDAPSQEVDEFSVNFGRLEHLVTWKYDAASNDYLRFQADEEHRDEDGTLIRAKNIAVMATKIVILDEVGRRRITTVGEGDALVFRDGRAIRGTWKRPSLSERTRFYDQTGVEIAFNAGTTWIEVISSLEKVIVE